MCECCSYICSINRNVDVNKDLRYYTAYQFIKNISIYACACLSGQASSTESKPKQDVKDSLLKI